jgi:hypothetical protein
VSEPAARPFASAINAGAADYRALFALWSRREGLADPPLAEACDRILAQFERDRGRYADVLEPSFSWSPGAPCLRRLSYAFPGFRGDPAGTADALRALCAPFGEGILAQVERPLRAARHPAVAQPIFGFAHDGRPAARRVKLYLQFEDGRDRAALELAERILGAQLAGRLPSGGALHLLGVDLGERGVVGAKLYVLHRRLDVASVASRIGRAPLVEALAARGQRELRDVLAIHRLSAPGDPGLLRAAEIDFAPGDSGLAWADLRPLLPAPACAAFAAVEAAFPIRVRRVSVPVGRDDKLNVYYVLDPAVRR